MEMSIGHMSFFHKGSDLNIEIASISQSHILISVCF